ncbi:hypothetical protein [Oceanisphaera arctica]|uniref:hypothetical protein n=1 Tax=Oceanisphaera arctica TaxID=641510 RepID=UPI0011B0227B|nr:hypothetical protein [Oceanisphaera arctica]GHA20127.1 hypothetical protein GCM10007082_20980 [Oceanisphaera arctica]
MSMQKKTLAILVALSVGASFGAVANGSDQGHTTGNGHRQKVVEHEHDYDHEHDHSGDWKGKKRGRRGGGDSYTRGDSLRLSVGDIDIYAVGQAIESKQKAELGNFDFNWDQKKNDASADADAKANPDLTSGRQGMKKRRYGYGHPSSEADLASNSADGGKAFAVASSSMKVRTGDNTVGNSAAFHGIGTQTAVSGMNVSVQNSVNINATNF